MTKRAESSENNRSSVKCTRLLEARGNRHSAPLTKIGRSPKDGSRANGSEEPSGKFVQVKTDAPAQRAKFARLLYGFAGMERGRGREKERSGIN